jgi:c-di-GMP-binding flagellar brake protein YcgR
MEVTDILKGLCARNVSGDIHYALQLEQIKTARFRFLALESDAICIDQPNNIDEEVSVGSGEVVTIYFTQGNDRWSFESRVEKLRRIVRLNDKKRVVGMALALPTQLRIQQRRSDYRVGVASLGQHCQIVKESDQAPNACDTTAKPYQCAIRDISARGMGVVLHAGELLGVKSGDRFFVEFELGDGRGVRVAIAKLCHSKTIGAEYKQLWGMRLVPMPTVDFEEQKADLAHFVAEVQRMKLRRKR